MTQALQFVFDTIKDAGDWLFSWQFQGVSFGVFIVAFIMMSILISRLFN